jgi:dipeptidyl-peptidase-4
MKERSVNTHSPARFSVGIAVPLFIAVLVLAGPQEKQRLTFDQIFKNGEPRLLASLPNVTGWADEENYLEVKKKEGDERQKLYAVNVKSGEEKVYRDLGQYRELLPKGVDSTSPAASNSSFTRLIFTGDKDLYYLNTETREVKRLTESKSEEENPVISPDGNAVAFTRDNNLYSVELATGKETQYTADGGDLVYNGRASWVYYEEILGRASRYRAFWWSPDSRRILFYRFDDSVVPMFPLFGSEGQHGLLEKTRYPKAGDPNPEVKVGVATVGEPEKIVWADFNEKLDQYFGPPFWTPDGKQAFVQWMNRGQDTLIMYGVDPATGRKKKVYQESQPSWVEFFESIQFLKKSPAFIVKTDKDGWAHLYVYDMHGKLKNRLTQGKWGVGDIRAVDETAGVVYFTANKEASTRTDLYRVYLNGLGLARLTTGPYTHAITMSPAGSYFVSRYSNSTTPARLALFTSQGNLVKGLGDSKTKAFDDYTLANTEMIRIMTEDGVELPASITLPTDFDPNKRYPVIISVYGGPLSSTVSDTWRGLSYQWLALEGAIQMSVDHRGSGHFGKQGASVMHRNLGKWEMHDYIEAARWLRAKPYVDTNRICITGGSYGGYVTCLALTYGADYFTHGIASYSVTDWQLYDSHYTERYMDSKTENPEGYAFGSVMTHAEKYRGLLRIVHGTMDDNVHMQNSIQLVDRLEELGKHFEFMLYPGGRHGWRGAKATHDRNETYRFYYTYLLAREFPAEQFKDIRTGRRF